MSYLAVNKDESERIFNEIPQRCDDIIYDEDDVFPSGRRTDKYFWGVEICSRYNNDIDYGIELPKGTIELLIGRKLTWKNRPIKFTKLKRVK